MAAPIQDIHESGFRIDTSNKQKSPSRSSQSDVNSSITPALTQAERDFENNVEALFTSFSNAVSNDTGARGSITDDTNNNLITSPNINKHVARTNMIAKNTSVASSGTTHMQLQTQPSRSSTMTSDSYNYGDNVRRIYSFHSWLFCPPIDILKSCT